MLKGTFDFGARKGEKVSKSLSTISIIHIEINIGF
jgi:hypothetical protein